VVTRALNLHRLPTNYDFPDPTREAIDATRGALVLEFGTAW
jgi:hypothetical protein